MSAANQDQLNIFDENEQVIGQETRAVVHRDGLWHQEIHVWFYTPQQEVIFQHRAPDKDSYPDLLDATVGGHVEIGSNYEESAIKETKEETGLDIKLADLIFIKKDRRQTVDPATKTINNCWGVVYAYEYRGRLEDLRIEEGKAVGFEAWLIADLLQLGPEDIKKFIPFYFQAAGRDILLALEKIIKTGKENFSAPDAV